MAGNENPTQSSSISLLASDAAIISKWHDYPERFQLLSYKLKNRKIYFCTDKVRRFGSPNAFGAI